MKSKINHLISAVVVVIFTALAIASDEESSDNSGNAENSAKVEVGDVLKTRYFDVVVNQVGLQRSVRIDGFQDLKPVQDIQYLIINVSFKNTDTESRMLDEGSVWIKYNNKNYQFDKSETILKDGWGLFLDQINPLVTKTTNIVYKIPMEIKGPAYWQPGRANNNQRIYLGDLE